MQSNSSPSDMQLEFPVTSSLTTRVGTDNQGLSAPWGIRKLAGPVSKERIAGEMWAVGRRGHAARC